MLTFVAGFVAVCAGIGWYPFPALHTQPLPNLNPMRSPPSTVLCP